MTAGPITIACTGHRALGRYPRARTVIRRALRHLVELHPGGLWLAGGAVGADRVVVDELLELGQRVQLVLPCPVEAQAAPWSAAERQALESQIARVEAVEVVRRSYGPGGYHQRNRRMVKRADLLVAFCDPAVPFGGTVSTMRLAHQLGVPVHWVAL
jgi:uncharacterized phage-like protein YoqJ